MLTAAKVANGNEQVLVRHAVPGAEEAENGMAKPSTDHVKIEDSTEVEQKASIAMANHEDV